MFNKLWNWLTLPRYVEFGTVDDMSLEREFAIKVYQTKRKNFDIAIGKLMKFERDLELTNSGLLLTDEAAYERAVIDFEQAKKSGKIDDLNRVIVQEEIIYP